MIIITRQSHRRGFIKLIAESCRVGDTAWSLLSTYCCQSEYCEVAWLGWPLEKPEKPEEKSQVQHYVSVGTSSCHQTWKAAFWSRDFSMYPQKHIAPFVQILQCLKSGAQERAEKSLEHSTWQPYSVNKLVIVCMQPRGIARLLTQGFPLKNAIAPRNFDHAHFLCHTLLIGAHLLLIVRNDFFYM